jgi:prephenate dehydratase
MIRVGIQGVKAAFHDRAAREYFAGVEDLELLECSSFQILCEALKKGETAFSLMAIENSIAGSILTNYLLLERYDLKVIGEVYLRIEMCLMALAGQKLTEIDTVYSHPMALLQCQDFLAKHPHIKAMAANDTAESAKEIKQNSLKKVAAIASELAAQEYGLEILEKGIESDKQNYTRFLVLSRGEHFRLNERPDKSSLRFEISHRPGSLLSVLSTFLSHGINMTKIQSVPLPGRPYEYSFHVDLEWENKTEYNLAIEELKLKTVRLVEFGVYQKDAKPQLIGSL